MPLRSIQLRLFVLLLRAFAAVVLLTTIIILLITGAYLAFSQSGKFLFNPPIFSALESYYLGHGSWDGVEVIFTEELIWPFPDFSVRWNNVVLVDASGRVCADHGHTDTPLVGSAYVSQPNDQIYPLQVRDQAIGTLVVAREHSGNPLNLLFRLLGPVALFSTLPAILTLLVGMLLSRRMVYPLADVIAAAQTVASGDLTARVTVRGPQDLQALTDSFNQMAGALERSDRERRNMLADVAHELRTPISVIRGRLEGMLDGIYQPDEARIAQALEETYLLERLVDDLRTLTLAEARQLHFDLRPTDLKDLAERAIHLFAAEAAEKVITLSLEAGDHLPLIMADPQRIEQVIGNLVSNALRYVPQGGQITLHITANDQGLEFSVSDNGPGVAAADLPHIFDRFWRGDKSRSRQAGGAGLGLAIARQLIEAQGGKVFAQSRYGGGLVVGFRLPPQA